MIEHEFHTYGLDAIDPTARDKFKEFYNHELVQRTEELKKETESLNAKKTPATGNKSKPATTIEDFDSTSDEVNGRTIDNSGLTKNTNFSEMTKVDNPKIAKAKATPKRKVKGMFSESERSESEQEIPQAKENRGRKRSMESVASTPRSTPRSSPSPSTRSAPRIPPSNTSRKGGSSGIFSDLTEESEQEVTQLSGRAKRLANRNLKQDEFLSVPLEKPSQAMMNAPKKKKGKKENSVSPPPTTALHLVPPLPPPPLPAPSAFDPEVFYQMLMTRFQADMDKAIADKIANQRIGIAEMVEPAPASAPPSPAPAAKASSKPPRIHGKARRRDSEFTSAS